MTKKNMVSVLAVVGGFIAVQACTSSDDTPSAQTTPDAATSDAAETPADGASTVPDATSDASNATCNAFTGSAPASAGDDCHDLVNGGAFITATSDPGPMPVGTGGTISDGLYYLTEVKTYPGSALAGATVKLTVLIKDGTSYQVTDIQGNPKTLRKTEASNPDGGNGILTCSTSGPESLAITSYTATCDEIRTYDATAKFMTKLARQQ